MARRIRVGDTVAVSRGSRELIAEVIEDRGDLGVDGEQIVRIGWFPAEVEEQVEYEVPVSELRVLSAEEAAALSGSRGAR
jgi:hypothetical protein